VKHRISDVDTAEHPSRRQRAHESISSWHESDDIPFSITTRSAVSKPFDVPNPYVIAETNSPAEALDAPRTENKASMLGNPERDNSVVSLSISEFPDPGLLIRRTMPTGQSAMLKGKEPAMASQSPVPERVAGEGTTANPVALNTKDSLNVLSESTPAVIDSPGRGLPPPQKDLQEYGAESSQQNWRLGGTVKQAPVVSQAPIVTSAPVVFPGLSMEIQLMTMRHTLQQALARESESNNESFKKSIRLSVLENFIKTNNDIDPKDIYKQLGLEP